MLEGAAPIEDIYPSLIANFPTFAQELGTFLEKNHGQMATLTTAKELVNQYASELTRLATLLTDGIKKEDDPKALYIAVTAPSRKHPDYHPDDPYQTGIIKGKHRYHILDRISTSTSGNDLLLLNQRISYQSDTGAEVHGIKKDKDNLGQFRIATNGGIEGYIPLTDGIVFHVNDEVFRPPALGGFVRVLPGDIHHHERETLGTDNRHGPARVLIVAGFGFGYGTKIPAESHSLKINGFGTIPVTNFADISRYISFK